MAEIAAAMVPAEEFGGPLPPGVGPEDGGDEMDVTGLLDLAATTLMANF